MSEKNEEGRIKKPSSIFDETKKRIGELSQAAGKVIAEHTVESGDSLGALALKYYGHATPEYWQVIYQANKAVIGDNPNVIKRGIILKIPELPQNLKI